MTERSLNKGWYNIRVYWANRYKNVLNVLTEYVFTFYLHCYNTIKHKLKNNSLLHFFDCVLLSLGYIGNLSLLRMNTSIGFPVSKQKCSGSLVNVFSFMNIMKLNDHYSL